jgi:hypothetical protein
MLRQPRLVRNITLRRLKPVLLRQPRPVRSITLRQPRLIRNLPRMLNRPPGQSSTPLPPPTLRRLTLRRMKSTRSS